MKRKEYMQPTLEVVTIETTGMLAISTLELNGGLDGVEFDVNGGNPDDAGAHFFDDEDDWNWSAE